MRIITNASMNRCKYVIRFTVSQNTGKRSPAILQIPMIFSLHVTFFERNNLLIKIFFPP